MTKSPKQNINANGEIDDLVALYRAPLMGYFSRRVGSTSDAEDLTQEVFVRLVRNVELGEVENPQAYIFQIASNLLADRARRAQSRQVTAHQPFDDVVHGATNTSPESILLARQDLALIKSALLTLPKKTSAIFILHRFEGLKYREIASLLGVSVSTVEKHIITALSAIAKSLGRR